MTPLPMIDTANAKPARDADKSDVQTPQDSPPEDEAVSFASMFAADDAADQDRSAPKLNEAGMPTGEESIGEEPKSPDFAIVDVAKPKADPSTAVPVAAQTRGARAAAVERPLSEDLSALRADPGRSVVVADKPVPEQRASLVQRMVEGKMPVSTDAKSSATTAVSETAKARAAPSVAAQPVGRPRTSDIDMAPPLDQVTKPTVSETKNLTPSKPVLPTIIEQQASKTRVDPNELETIPRQTISETDPIPKVNEAKTSVTPAVAQSVLPTQPTRIGDDIQKTIATLLTGEAELAQSVLPGDRSTTPAAPQITTTSTAYGADTARHVAQQMAAQVTQHAGRMTEIALNPEELGRVRLAMTAVDAAITLSVLAERPETVDLLRRHIDVLAQEFRALGYDDINFSFNDDGRADDGPALAPDGTAIEQNEDLETPVQLAMRPISGLDLRL